ncbi:Probable prolyl 4-hydroxylase [Seminavis robusta]|uniref:Probable prolyl 4-hydroxylase n=1 Tax=Seminavis robusta TaxID=568900 RepID=A0A9N8EFX9_9STRA|nr:Probable prolyl 4-hydroxylase [Seminavis robusta]|eukprot:Sro1021_g232220.1 Probable prolyl 4-hydroxylase (647) ;mRNA; r:9794-11734
MTTTSAALNSNEPQRVVAPLEIMDSQEEEEKELLCKETSDDDDDDEYDSDYDDDEDSSSGSWKDLIVWSEWRQHGVAILVAILATILATVWQHYAQQQEHDYHLFESSSSSSASSNAYASTFRHEHLDGYQRTANISFCPSTLKSKVEQHLELFDFHVPLESVDAVQLHYVADAMEDDDYSTVLAKRVPSKLTIHDPEYHCLRQRVVQANENKKSYVTGTTYFYQPPSFLDMYPHLKDILPEQQQQQPTKSITGLTDKNKKKRQPKPASLSFTGFAAKFINLSPHPILLHWDGKGGHANSQRLVGEIAPFDSLGTATTPGQSFFVSPVYDSSHALDRWVVTADDSVMVHEDSTKNHHKWTPADWQLYHMQMANLEFAQHYLIASHRTWLAHFPRPFPVHPMIAATHVGQQHSVKLEDRTLPLEVVSVTPRVLAMDDFLTHDECQALMSLAAAQGLQGSTLYAGGMAQQQRDLSTRSSTNAWLSRETSQLTDRIYRRAAQLLQMKESLLQQPAFYHHDEDDEEAPDYTQHSIAESLQVVRYQPGEEYTAHHDFVYPSARHRYQPTRYATLLLYLNDDFTGGQTNFPRAVNPSKHDGITITPKAGKAVLFYNMLPDGNVDDLSQHQSLPVENGEKWLANLWVWDPVIN